MSQDGWKERYQTCQVRDQEQAHKDGLEIAALREELIKCSAELRESQADVLAYREMLAAEKADNRSGRARYDLYRAAAIDKVKKLIAVIAALKTRAT